MAFSILEEVEARLLLGPVKEQPEAGALYFLHGSVDHPKL